MTNHDDIIEQGRAMHERINSNIDQLTTSLEVSFLIFLAMLVIIGLSIFIGSRVKR